VIAGFATAEGTLQFAERFFSHREAAFYRTVQDLHLSSIGLGTYLGDADDDVDRAYTNAVLAAARGGINVFDTAINYRNQRSEHSIGAALRELINDGEIQRDQLMVCTKAGFLTQGAVPKTLLPEDVAGGMHSMAPDFLADQIDRSRENLGLDTLDVFYLHNPETQLRFIAAGEFNERIGRAFAKLEDLATAGRIHFYGAATWDGFRKPGALSLAALVEIATGIAGDEHHFRFIQLPFNLGMIEALSQPLEDGRNVLDIAQSLGIAVVASATIHQAQLSRNLPESIAARIPGLQTDAQRAIQFTRSTPGITVALVGMSDSEHVQENLGVAAVEPMHRQDYEKLFVRA
jgi:aryl-alcohol dehydrogenase-like predicted oxidoreductase